MKRNESTYEFWHRPRSEFTHPFREFEIYGILYIILQLEYTLWREVC